ncbi:hypothetical protein RhiJN_23246 [Ceratobasidium sp. AG-Ba]|nr:hypothetical protein RhiJN_23246 [Ceratobasidium sp. AG-Ba]
MQVRAINFKIIHGKLLDFNDIVEELPQQPTVSTVVELAAEVDDVRNTLRILRSDPRNCEDENFDAFTWRSGLWMATRFSNPILRARCIHSLEKQNLRADQYLWFYREFDITDWADKVVDLLSAPSTSLTIDEINNMGTDLLAVVIVEREGRLKEEAQRLKEAGQQLKEEGQQLKEETQRLKEETQRLRNELEMLRPAKRLRTRRT